MTPRKPEVATIVDAAHPPGYRQCYGSGGRPPAPRKGTVNAGSSVWRDVAQRRGPISNAGTWKPSAERNIDDRFG